MTVFLRALYGPFGESEEGMPGTGGHRLCWYFFGIRENNSMGRWKLSFYLTTRRYSAAAVGDCVPWIRGLPHVVSPVVHPDAYVPDAPMIHGATYVDILRKRLPPEAIARASALAIATARGSLPLSLEQRP